MDRQKHKAKQWLICMKIIKYIHPPNSSLTYYSVIIICIHPAREWIWYAFQPLVGGMNHVVVTVYFLVSTAGLLLVVLLLFSSVLSGVGIRKRREQHNDGITVRKNHGLVFSSVQEQQQLCCRLVVKSCDAGGGFRISTKKLLVYFVWCEEHTIRNPR